MYTVFHILVSLDCSRNDEMRKQLLARFPFEKFVISSEGREILSVTVSEEDDQLSHLKNIKDFLIQNGPLLKNLTKSGKFSNPHIDIAFEPEDNQKKVYSELVFDAELIRLLDDFKTELHISVYATL